MRIKLLASVVPLLLAGTIAGVELAPGTRPCISIGGKSLQIATAPWQSQSHVSFTSDLHAASVRVQVVDRPELADFTVIDDMDTAEAESCSLGSDVKFVSVAPHASDDEPVIYLSTDAGADYRIFVQSRTLSVEDAAALVVGANRARTTQRTAGL